jgi:hypothetical protein
MDTDFQKDFDANITNSREFELSRLPFAPISEIRVNSASVIRIPPWFNKYTKYTKGSRNRKESTTDAHG